MTVTEKLYSWALPFSLALSILVASENSVAMDEPGDQLLFDISSGLLIETIGQISRRTGMNILIQQASDASLIANPVKGHYTAEEAIKIAIEDLGLACQSKRGSGGFIVRHAALSVVAQLHPTVVTDYITDNSTLSRSATIVPLSLFEIAQSIQSIDSEVIESSGLILADDVISMVSGALFIEASGVFREISLRGFPYPSTALNGKVTHRYINPPDLFRVDRIDVLKGPASVLFGGIEAGGVVNFLLKAPQIERRTELLSEFNSQGLKRVGIDTTGSLDFRNRWRYRTIGIAQKDGQDDETADPYFWGLYPSLAYHFRSGGNLTLDVTHEKENDTSIKGGPHESMLNQELDRDIRLRAPWDFYQSKLSSYILHLQDRPVGNWIVSATMRKDLIRFEFEHATLVEVDASGFVRTSPFRADDTTNIEEVGLNLSRDSVINGWEINWLLGWQYFHTNEVVDTLITSGPDTLVNVYAPVFTDSPGDFFKTQEINVTTIQNAIFSQVFLQPNTKFSLLAGLRVDRYKMQYLSANRIRMVSVHLASRETLISPRISLSYKLSPSINVFVNASKGFTPHHTGDANTITLRGSHFDVSTTKPLDVIQNEVGVKYYFDEKLLITSTFFQTKRKNISSLTEDLSRNVRIKDDEHKGLELDLYGHIQPNWKLNASYTLLDTQTYHSTIDAVSVTYVPLEKRSEARIAPKRMAKISNSYTIQGGFLNEVGFNLGLTYVGKRYADDQNTILLDSYTRVDASVFKSSSRFEWQIGVRNLFDKNYYAGVWQNALQTSVYGDGRTIYARVSVKF